MQTIYMDNAATTQLCGESVARAEQYLKENYFNPSAMYKEGFALSRELKAAREKLVSYVADTASYDLTFTSCGTEADNTAVFGYARRGNAVTSAGEHSAILAPFAELKNRNVAETRFAPLEADGRVNVGKLLELVDEKTTFVSVMHVNNETGAINDINAVAKKVKEKNPRVVFHSDGVQGFGKIPFRLGKEVDLYSLSAHKIGGLKGTGALIRKKRCRSARIFSAADRKTAGAAAPKTCSASKRWNMRRKRNFLRLQRITNALLRIANRSGRRLIREFSPASLPKTARRIF